jgi:hypothetical protein
MGYGKVGSQDRGTSWRFDTVNMTIKIELKDQQLIVRSRRYAEITLT